MLFHFTTLLPPLSRTLQPSEKTKKAILIGWLFSGIIGATGLTIVTIWDRYQRTQTQLQQTMTRVEQLENRVLWLMREQANRVETGP